MNLFTKVDIPQSGIKINYQTKLAFFGSCFADNISLRFAERKFHVLANPLGVIYNPLSIENQIGKIAGEMRAENCLAESWSLWDAQGSFSEEALGKVVAKTLDFLKTADVVFITLGTAFVYFLKETGKAVCNCHKQSAELFERRLISVDEAADALKNTVAVLRKINEKAHIVFTVSPLRHLNDGAHGNNISKSTLHLAVEKVVQEFASENRSAEGSRTTVSYFPSYEIVMDELRDYRFYAEDMTHLSKVAEDYIFERMQATYCDEATIANTKLVEKYMKMVNHRIVDPSSPKVAELNQQIAEKAVQLEKQISGLDLSK